MINLLTMREIIKAIDVEITFGLSTSGAYKKFRTIKKGLNKKKNDIITIEEFCIVTGFKEEVIRKNIRMVDGKSKLELYKEKNELVEVPNDTKSTSKQFPKSQPYEFQKPNRWDY